MAYRPTPKTEARKAAMRARILVAARKLFAEQGYEATTLQQIVKEAQTSIGNCYFYFADKEAILLTVASDLRAEVATRIDAAIAGLPPGPVLLAAAVYIGVVVTLENADVARFALSDTAHPSLRSLTISQFVERVERAFAAQPALFASWHDATPQMAALAWHAAPNFLIEAAVNGRLTEPPERIARFLVRWNLQALGLPSEAIDAAIVHMERHLHANLVQSPNVTDLSEEQL